VKTGRLRLYPDAGKAFIVTLVDAEPFYYGRI